MVIEMVDWWPQIQIYSLKERVERIAEVQLHKSMEWGGRSNKGKPQEQWLLCPH